MGSTSSASAPNATPKCGMVRLRCPRGVTENLILVPVPAFDPDQTQSANTKRDHTALYELMYRARCEPTVCHWFSSQLQSAASAPNTPTSAIDRTQQIAPAPETLDAYLRTELSLMTPADRWALVRFDDAEVNAPDATASLLSFVESHASAASVVAFASLSGTTGDADRDLSVFLTKPYLNESKSLVLFQLLAHGCCDTDGWAPSSFRLPALSLRLAKGNLPCLRLVQKLNRLYLRHLESPLAVSSFGDAVVCSCDVIAVTDLIVGLASSVVSDGNGLEIQAAQGDAESVVCPSAIDSFVLNAKAIWSAENAIVNLKEPNPKASAPKPRRLRKPRGGASVSSSSISKSSSGTLTPVFAASTPEVLPVEAAEVCMGQPCALDQDSRRPSLGASPESNSEDGISPLSTRGNSLRLSPLPQAIETSQSTNSISTSTASVHRHDVYNCGPLYEEGAEVAPEDQHNEGNGQHDLAVYVQDQLPVHVRVGDEGWRPVYWKGTPGSWLELRRATVQPCIAQGKLLVQACGCAEFMDVDGAIKRIDTMASRSSGFSTHLTGPAAKVPTVEVALPLRAPATVYYLTGSDQEPMNVHAVAELLQ